MLDYLDVAQSSTLEISPISDQDIMDTFEELKERDCKLSEKLKTIAVYEQERRVLVISFEQMKEALEKTTTEIRSFIQMKQEKRAESEKTKSGIAALKDILESITEEKKSATHELDEMISSQSNLVMELEDKIVLLNEGLRVVKMQAMSEYDSLVKEYDLLLAKSQQIHHLHKVISLLQAKTMQPAIIVDHLLQQEASKRAKSAYAAFEVRNAMPILLRQYPLCLGTTHGTGGRDSRKNGRSSGIFQGRGGGSEADQQCTEELSTN